MFGRPSLAFACLLLSGSAAVAQSEPPSGLRYVLPEGPGAIVVPVNGWVPQELNLLDGGTRLAVQMKDQASPLVASYLLFSNGNQAATPDHCRDAVITPVLKNLQGHATVVDQQQSARKTSHGETLAVSSYMISRAGDVALNQQNVFGFFGSGQTCFEIHLSLPAFERSQQPLVEAALNSFTFDPEYVPKAADYGVIGTLLFNYLHDFKSAATYYQRTLDTLPKAELSGPQASVIGRVTVGQLAMAYGMSGDVARSRSVNEAAIARDPTYPMYYYMLADADAEEGNAAAAQRHLQQAFDRRQNTLPSLSMPDPTKDESILKLKSNAGFWSFVEALPSQKAN